MEAIKGRGASFNPQNRFEKINIFLDEEPHSFRTQYFKDSSQTILSKNDNPDVGFSVSLNPYRGCEHGCVYCYARPTHEYLGFSPGVDFESKIFVKENAPELLKKELSSKKWIPQVVALSGVTDCYQPIEKKLQITRKCLEVFRDFANPIVIITKNSLVARDCDVLSDLAKQRAVMVNISVTSLDPKLASILEPRASMPALRLKTIEILAKAGIPVGVMVAPVIPAINDFEIPAILKAVKDAGAQRASYVMLRLPYAVKDLFASWLHQHFPDRMNKVLHRIEEMRNGKLYDSNWGSRMRGEGVFAKQIEDLFDVSINKYGLNRKKINLSTAYFCSPKPSQLNLFS